MKSALEVGKRVVELVKQKKFMQAVDELYSPDVVSIEVVGMPEIPARMEGIKAIRGKTEWWENNHEIHRMDAKGPYPHGDRFIIWYQVDVTPKSGPNAGNRGVFDEAGLYTVKDGKIVQEEFFYAMPG